MGEGVRTVGHSPLKISSTCDREQIYNNTQFGEDNYSFKSRTEYEQSKGKTPALLQKNSPVTVILAIIPN